MNLLIVDDLPTNLKLLRAQLEAEGHAVFEAHDGEDALALLERQRVDVVISDILMPRMDGYRFCHEIRKHARLHDLPVILYTSTYTSPSDEKLALDVGADKYLKKPASIETLVAALHEVTVIPHAAPRPEALQKVEVLKEYSERLVSKLEEKNIGLEQAIAERRASEERFRQLAEHIDEVFWMTDVAKNEMIYISPAYEVVWGRTCASLYASPRNWLDDIHPEDRERIVQSTFTNQATGTYDEEYRIVRPDGAIRWIHDRAFPVRNQTGEVYRIVGVAQDITERKRAEDELRKSEEFKDAILNSVASHIAVLDRTGAIVAVNAPWQRFALESPMRTGAPARSTGIGVNYLDVCRQSSGESVEGAMAAHDGIQAVLEGRLTSFTLEYPCHSPEAQRWFSLVVTPLGKAGQGVVVSHSTITERKLAETALQESLREKESLLKEIHHRVKNNMQVISSLLRLQSGQIDNPIAKAALQDMQNRVRSMALIHEHLYRSENLAEVDMAAYLKQLCTKLFHALVARPITIQLHMDVAPIHLEIDQAIPCGLLINELVTNALKHAFPQGRAGGVRIELQPVEGGPQLRLRVADNGVGLPVDFDLENSTSLGLQLVGDLTRQLGGQLELNRGAGAVFEVVFTPRNIYRSDGVKE